MQNVWANALNSWLIVQFLCTVLAGAVSGFAMWRRSRAHRILAHDRHQRVVREQLRQSHPVRDPLARFPRQPSTTSLLPVGDTVRRRWAGDDAVDRSAVEGLTKAPRRLSTRPHAAQSPAYALRNKKTVKITRPIHRESKNNTPHPSWR